MHDHRPNKRYRSRKTWRRKIEAFWRVNPIERCELQFADCWDTFGLAPAHAKNGNDRFTFEDEAEVVAACQKCHFTADGEMSKEARYELFRQIIDSRGFSCGCGQPIPPPLKQCSTCEQVFSAQPNQIRSI